jgi:hypothetical protein
MSIKFYFDLWLSKIKKFKVYDEWCELNNESLIESYIN